MRVLTMFLSILALTSIITELSYGDFIDLDGDGKADPVTVSVDEGNPMPWTGLLSSTGYSQSTALGSFGKIGSHISYGRWSSSETLDKSVITLQSNGSARWRVIGADGNKSKYDFGTNKDTFISGIDVDGNGIYDALLVLDRGSEETLTFLGVLNPFMEGSDRETFTYKLGKSCYPFTYMDTDGDGKDEICYFTPEKRTTSSLAKKRRRKKKRNRNRFTGRFNISCVDGQTGKEIATGLAPKLFQLPVRVKRGEGQSDLLAYVRKRKRRTIIFVRDLAGNLLHKLVTAKGTVIIGDFTGDGIEDVGVAFETTMVFFDTQTGSSTFIPTPSGVHIDLNNINEFGDSTNPFLDTRTLKRTQSDSCSSAGSCTKVMDSTDGNGGFLWKPVSESNGKLAVLLPANLSPSKVTIEKGGAVIETLRFAGRTNPNRTTWRSDKRAGGDFPDGVTVVAKEASDRICWQIGDSGKRHD